MKYVTIDNILLETAGRKINYNFECEFIGKKLKDNYEDNYNKLEHEYFESDIFLERAITFSYDLKTDDEGYIKDLEVHKYRDKYFGHGRPVVDELNVTKKDENAIRQCLNDSIALTLDDEYDSLIARIIKSDELPNGYRLKNISAKGVILNDKRNKCITISKDSIKRSLALSHKYLDILYDETLLKENEEFFNKDEIKPLLAITSCCDYSGYHNLDKLQKEANRREIIRKSTSGYKELVKSIKAGDIDNVKQFAEYSVIYDNDASYNMTHPLLLAITMHPEYVDLLIKSGSYANPKGYVNKNKVSTHSAIDILYANKDYNSLSKIAECYDPEKIENNTAKPAWGETNTYKSAISSFTSNVFSCLEKSLDKKAAEILIPHTYGMKVYSSQFSYELDIDQINFLTSFDNIRIDWEQKYFEKVYPLDKQLCQKMVEQGCMLSSINYFIDVNSFELYKTAMEKWVKYQDLFLKPESYKKIFTRKKEWHDIAVKSVWRSSELDNECISEIFDYDKKEFDNVVSKYGINVSNVYSVKKHLNSFLDQKRIDSFKNYTKKYNITIYSNTLQDLQLYLDKYDLQEKEDLIEFIFERYNGVNYLSTGAYNSNLNEKKINDQFLQAVYKHGSHEIIEKCIDKYLIRYTNRVNDFTNHFKENYYQALFDCNEWACDILIKKVLDHLKHGEDDQTVFDGPYSDKIYLAKGEIYRTLRNLWYISGFGEWPPNEEKNNRRFEIVKKNMLYYVHNIDLSILSKEDGLYDWSRNASFSVLRDLKSFQLEDEAIIKKVISDFEKQDVF